MFWGGATPPDPPGLPVARKTRSACCLLPFVLLLLWPPVLQAQDASPGPPAAELIERVVAVVDERPLLLSDVRALALVRSLEPEAALEAAIDERLMYGEAAQVAQAEVSPAAER